MTTTTLTSTVTSIVYYQPPVQPLNYGYILLPIFVIGILIILIYSIHRGWIFKAKPTRSKFGAFSMKPKPSDDIKFYYKNKIWRYDNLKGAEMIKPFDALKNFTAKLYLYDDQLNLEETATFGKGQLRVSEDHIIDVLNGNPVYIISDKAGLDDKYNLLTLEYNNAQNVITKLRSMLIEGGKDSTAVDMVIKQREGLVDRSVHKQDKSDTYVPVQTPPGRPSV